MEITSPEKLAVWFNDRYQGAYRKIDAEDAREMTACGLICRYRYYSTSQDGETVRGILQYEQMREKRSAQQESAEDKLELLECKMCKQPLPPEPENKAGRRKEYCSECESFRNKERQKKLRRRRRKHLKPTIT